MAQRLGKEFGQMRLEAEVGEQLLRLDWRPTFALKARPGRHINLDEAKALRFAIKRDASNRER